MSAVLPWLFGRSTLAPPLQQLPHHFQLVVGRGSVQQGCGCGFAMLCSKSHKPGSRVLSQSVSRCGSGVVIVKTGGGVNRGPHTRCGHNTAFRKQHPRWHLGSLAAGSARAAYLSIPVRTRAASTSPSPTSCAPPLPRPTPGEG